MARPFAITAASNSVFLDDQRQGETSFTVSNQSGRSIEGRARLVTEEDEVESWITLQGNPQRSFTTAGTQEYTIEIDVPPDAPSGSYNFRLDVVGEERPDEQYVEGPTVTFEVPEAEPEPETQAFPWKIVAAIAAVLLIGGGVLAYQLLSGSGEAERVEVPDVSELRPGQAFDSLRSAGFSELDVEDNYNPNVSHGLVIGTTPEAEEEVAVDSTILLHVSRPLDEIPIDPNDIPDPNDTLIPVPNNTLPEIPN